MTEEPEFTPGTEHVKLLQTVADGPGVLFTILDPALLADRGLLDGDATAEDLDARVESWLHEQGEDVGVARALA